MSIFYIQSRSVCVMSWGFDSLCEQLSTPEATLPSIGSGCYKKALIQSAPTPPGTQQVITAGARTHTRTHTCAHAHTLVNYINEWITGCLLTLTPPDGNSSLEQSRCSLLFLTLQWTLSHSTNTQNVCFCLFRQTDTIIFNFILKIKLSINQV